MTLITHKVLYNAHELKLIKFKLNKLKISVYMGKCDKCIEVYISNI